MATPIESFRVLILGGGPAGLLTAQALKKQGIQATVFEQDAAVDARQRDWNFGIYWAQVPLSCHVIASEGDCLPEDLSKLIIEKGQVDRRPLNPDDVLPIYNGQSGELMKPVPAPNNIRLHRRNFLRILSTGIDIRYGKRVKFVESDGKTATAHFEDGTSESGNLLVGAEGAHSKVRDYLLGEVEAKPIPSPIFASATMAKLPEEAAAAFMKVHQRYFITFHPLGQFLWIGVHDNFENTKPGDWTFMIILSWLPKHEHDPSSLQGPAILADMKEKCVQYAEPFQSLIKAIPEDTKCWHNQLSYWITRPWDNHNSTVTLVGDAAHPMTFHRGQGLNNAIHDAASLAKHLSEMGTTVSDKGDSAVLTYEKEMWERGKLAVEGSNENSLTTHNWETLLNSPLFTSGLARATVKQPASNGVKKDT